MTLLPEMEANQRRSSRNAGDTRLNHTGAGLVLKFIHIADIHLGRPFSGLAGYSCDEKVLNICKNATEKSFNAAINYALSKNVDFVLIAGDTFDSLEQDFSSLLILKSGLKKLDEAGIKVFMICGNHDPSNTYNKISFNYSKSTNINIAGVTTEQPFYKFIYKDKNNNPTAVIHALSYTNQTFCENPAKYFSMPEKEESNLFNIGLLHCDLNGDNKSPYAPCPFAELQALGYNYWALGHIHIPSVNEKYIQYSGTIQSRNTKETGAHGIRYIEADNGQIIKNDFIPIDVVRFEDLSVDVSNAADLTQVYSLIFEAVDSLINKSSKICELFLIRIQLLGKINFYNELNEKFYTETAERIKSEFLDRVCISKITNLITAMIDEDTLKNDEGITGELYKVLQDSEVTERLFKETENQFKTQIYNCCFSDEEYNIFKQAVLNTAKEEGISICADIYNNGKKEE
ncbi:MAG: DNA repair exonuclease [Candidatus Gastranaerophilales bacterium]|nr:DNA repair exonuclease [Candidatus Gastranaerophilales bacterium]